MDEQFDISISKQQFDRPISKQRRQTVPVCEDISHHLVCSSIVLASDSAYF